MTDRDFCFWLQGFFEVANPKEMCEDQIKMVREHLNLVFEHAFAPKPAAEPPPVKEVPAKGIAEALEEMRKQQEDPEKLKPWQRLRPVRIC